MLGRNWPLLATLGFVASCGSEPLGSRTQQLTAEQIPCDEYSDAEIDSILKDKPKDFVDESGWVGGELKRAMVKLAGIPDKYLKSLYDLHRKNGFNISSEFMFGGVMGVTRFVNDVPIDVGIAARTGAADFAMQHEVGHAMQGLFGNNSKINQNIERVFQAESPAAALRSYARTSSAEYFAESFNNFYCSKKAHEFLERTLPDTYALLSANLEAPRFALDERPLPLAKDLWLKMHDAAGSPASGGSSAAKLSVATPVAVSKVLLCAGEKANCEQKQSEDMVFASASADGQRIDGRSVFVSQSELKLQDGAVHTILAYGKNGELLGARAVRLSLKTGR